MIMFPHYRYDYGDAPTEMGWRNEVIFILIGYNCSVFFVAVLQAPSTLIILCHFKTNFQLAISQKIILVLLIIIIIIILKINLKSEYV